MKTLMEDHEVVNFFNEAQDGKLLILEAVKNGHFDFLDHWISLMAPNDGDRISLPSYNGESLLTVILNSDVKDLKHGLDQLMTNEKLDIKSDDLKELYKAAYDSGKYATCISLLHNKALQNDLTKQEYAQMLLLSLAKLQESVKK